MEDKGEATVICSANLSGTDKCPRNCRACFYGGNIAIQWTEYAYGITQNRIQYFPDKETVKNEYIEAQNTYFSMAVNSAEVANNSIGQKMNALQTWLNQNFPDWSVEKLEL
jgi:hypothetical protein